MTAERLALVLVYADREGARSASSLFEFYRRWIEDGKPGGTVPGRGFTLDIKRGRT